MKAYLDHGLSMPREPMYWLLELRSAKAARGTKMKRLEESQGEGRLLYEPYPDIYISCLVLITRQYEKTYENLGIGSRMKKKVEDIVFRNKSVKLFWPDAFYSTETRCENWLSKKAQRLTLQLHFQQTTSTVPPRGHHYTLYPDHLPGNIAAWDSLLHYGTCTTSHVHRS
jgi:hypothetical protein